MLLLFRNYALVILASILLPAMPAGAVEYSLSAIVDQNVSYDGNLAMFPDPSSAQQDLRDKYITGYELAPRLNLRARSQRGQLDLTTVASFSRFSDQLYDSDDQIVSLTYARTNERTKWDVEASVDRSSTRSRIAELGSIVAASRLESYSLSPRWTRVLNERNSIALGANGATVDYDSGRFVDYDYYGFDVTWLRQLTEKTQFQLAVYQSTLDSGEKPENTEFETQGLTIALVRNVNEALSTNFSFGARQVETTSGIFCDFFSFLFGQCSQLGARIGSAVSDDDGFTASAGVDYTAQAWNISASVSRSLVPNGTVGSLLETDTLRLNYARQLRETLFFELTFSATQEDLLGSDDFERDRLRIEPRLRWQFAEQWSLISSVGHNSRDELRSGSQNDAEGTSISFRVRYAHPRASWSR